jgi:GYF domain 2
LSEPKWFVRKLDKSEVLGPIAAHSIVELLQRGELTWLSLIAKRGDPEWQILEQNHEIKSLCRREFDSESSEPAWVFARPGSTSVVKKIWGPWSLQQSIREIARGEVTFDDIAWRPGMSNWVRVGDMSEFGSLSQVPAIEASRHAEPSPVGEEPSSEELLRNVFQFGGRGALDGSQQTSDTPDDSVAVIFGEDLTNMPSWLKVIDSGRVDF